REKPQRGRVLAVGPGARDEDGKYIEMDVAEGEEIIFSKYGGTEIKLGTDEVLILRESDVLAKVVSTGGKAKRKYAAATARLAFAWEERSGLQMGGSSVGMT